MRNVERDHFRTRGQASAVKTSRGTPIRIVVTGSECTGKTTLAADIATRLLVPCSEEGARAYLDRIHRPLTAADIEPIAHLQIEFEDRAIRASDHLVILDTDLVSTVVYSRQYHQHCPHWIARQAIERQADLYLLCSTDLPWVEEELQRGQGTAEERRRVHQAFVSELDHVQAHYQPVKGLGEERARCALAFIAQYFDIREQLHEPATEP
mgnify:FL=1